MDLQQPTAKLHDFGVSNLTKIKIQNPNPNHREQVDGERITLKKKTSKNNKNNSKGKENNGAMKMDQDRDQLRMPVFRPQLTPQEIADDLFDLGIGPSRPQRSTKKARAVRRDIDQVTPGVWLAHIDIKRYEVLEDTKGKTKV